jgi:O-antigen/teichoic acid export membrane protein
LIKNDLNFYWEKYFSHRKHLLNRAGIMAGARIVGLAFGFFGSAWAARCLGPRNFGISGMVLGVVVQASLVLGLMNETVLIREYKNAPDVETKTRLVQVSMGFRLIACLIISLVAAILLAFHMLPDDYHFAGWLFLPIMVLTGFQPLWVFQAAERQHFQSLIAVIQPFLTAALYFIFFKPGMSAGADLAVKTTILAIVIWIYWGALFRWLPLKGKWFNKGYWDMVKSLIVRSRWMFAAGLAINVYALLDLPMVGWLYSLEELGKYRTAVSIMGAAQSIFDIVPAILYPRFLEWKKMGEEVLWRRQVKLAWVFSGLGAVGTILAFLIMPTVYPFVFGPAFSRAAIPCVILLGSKCLIMVTTILYMGLVTDPRYDRKVFLITLLTAILSLTSNLIFIPKFGMYAAAVTNVASEVLVLSLCIVVGLKKIAASRAEAARLSDFLTGGNEK